MENWSPTHVHFPLPTYNIITVLFWSLTYLKGAGDLFKPISIRHFTDNYYWSIKIYIKKENLCLGNGFSLFCEAWTLQQMIDFISPERERSEMKITSVLGDIIESMISSHIEVTLMLDFQLCELSLLRVFYYLLSKAPQLTQMELYII